MTRMHDSPRSTLSWGVHAQCNWAQVEARVSLAVFNTAGQAASVIADVVLPAPAVPAAPILAPELIIGLDVALLST